MGAILFYLDIYKLMQILMHIFRKTNVHTRVHKNPLMINIIFAWNLHHWIQDTSYQSIYKKLNFYEISDKVFPFLIYIAGHTFSVEIISNDMVVAW